MKHQTLFGFHQFFHCSPLPVPGCNPGHHTAFNCHVSLVLFGLWQFLSLSLFFLILTVLCPGQYPVECPPIWVCLLFFLRLDWVYGLWERVPERLKCPSCHITLGGACCHHDITDEVTFVDSTVKLIFFSFPALFFGSRSLSLAHPSGRVV